MKRELDYFNIEDCYGGNQDWFCDPMMKLGGCAAVTACDLCIYLSVRKGSKHLYSFDINSLNKRDYVKFSNIMKPYLRPRMSGINTLQIYIDGLKKYLQDVNDECITIQPFDGSNFIDDAKEMVIKQIGRDIPIPFLLLKHKNRNLQNIVWHWFLIIGYEKFEDELFVKIATYGNYRWISLDELWDTGYEEKGGMVIVDIESKHP